MQIDLGGPHVFMSEQVLNGAYVVTVFQEVSGKAMAEGMAASGLVDSGGNIFLDGQMREEGRDMARLKFIRVLLRFAGCNACNESSL